MTTPTITEHTVRVGTSEIFYTEAGSGAAVVLLHGGGPGATGMSNFSRNVEELAKDFRVIVADMPGYGRSTRKTDLDNPLGFVAGAILGLLDVLDIDQAHFIGNSWGGACSLRIALDHPERVNRLVLLGPGGIGTTRRLPTVGIQRMLGYYGGTGPSRAKLDSFVRTYLVHDASSVPADLIDARYLDSIAPGAAEHYPLRTPNSLGAVLRLKDLDFTRDSRLAKLQTPTLVIWGAQDKVNPPNDGAVLAKTIPNCDLLLVANTGHWVQWERAELFNDITRAFLAGPG